MKDEDRFKILHEYSTPKVKVGRYLYCHYRAEEVQVGGYTNALIPWPYIKKNGPKSLIISSEFVRAIKNESEIGISFHWGISVSTVWKWRKAFGVGRINHGTKRLYKDYLHEKISEDDALYGQKIAMSKESNLKRSNSKLGHKMHPNTRTALLNAISKPKSESWKKSTSLRMKALHKKDPNIVKKLKIARKNKQENLWGVAEISQIGTDFDRIISERIGRSKQAIRYQRAQLGIPAFKKKWTKKELAFLGTDFDKKIAEIINHSISAIRAKRAELGIPRFKDPIWELKEIALLGTDSDMEIAKKTGRSLKAVRVKRLKLGILLLPNK